MNYFSPSAKCSEAELQDSGLAIREIADFNYKSGNFDFSIICQSRFQCASPAGSTLVAVGFGYSEGFLTQPDGARYPVSAQPFDIGFVPAGLPILFEATKSTGDMLFIELQDHYDLDPEICGRSVYSTTPCRGSWFTSSALIAELLKATRERLLDGSLRSGDFAVTYGRMIFNEVIKAFQLDIKVQRRDTNLSTAMIEQITAYIESHLDRSISVEGLAGIAGMSLHSFSRSFKTLTGQTPYQFVLDQRVQTARSLLLAGDGSIADVAYRCGFSSQSHMTNVFRRSLGVTPASFGPGELEADRLQV